MSIEAPSLLPALGRAVAQALGYPVDRLRLQPLGGGSIHATAKLESPAGLMFVKWSTTATDQFSAEAAGLDIMRNSGCSLSIPRPIAWQDAAPAFLLTEYFPPTPRCADFDRRLGRGLAEMHRQSSPKGFGFERDGYCGVTPQLNGWLSDWPTFYAQRRIGYQLRLTGERGLGQVALRDGQRLLQRLPDLLGDPEPPALIHGDLWSGNLLTATTGEPALIDPAAYYGHREAEFGMMVLFGGFGPQVVAAYEEVLPLQTGWRDRLDLYSLYHLLNHHTLFGGSYGAQAVKIIKRYV